MDGVSKMRINATMLALAALLLGSACANQSTTKAGLDGNSSVQVSSIRWDEITANAPARVSNGNLIFMR